MSIGNWLYTKEDTFIINSAYDMWSGLCILLGGPKKHVDFKGVSSVYNGCNAFETWHSCANDTRSCQPEQVKIINTFEVRSDSKYILTNTHTTL